MSAEVKALIAAAQEAERRCRRYSRVADMLDKLTLPLYIPASAVTVAYLLYGIQHVAAVGLALWIAGYAAYILRDVYSSKATKAARRACVFRHLAEAALEIEKLKEKITKKNDVA